MFITWFKGFIDLFFGLGLFFNAALFIPQAIKIYKNKDASELSLFTFAGFNVIQFFAVLHGYFEKDYILLLGFLLSLITSGTVTILIIFYRNQLTNTP